MAELPFFPMAIDAYLADTKHLSDAEHGRYHLVLYELWRAPKQRIPNDDKWLARRFNRTVARVQAELRPLIKEFCKCDGNWITQKRLSKEFEYARAKVKQRSDAAKSRWNKEKNQYERICETDASPHASRNALIPTPTLKESSSSSTESDAAREAQRAGGARLARPARDEMAKTMKALAERKRAT